MKLRTTASEPPRMVLWAILEGTQRIARATRFALRAALVHLRSARRAPLCFVRTEIIRVE